MDRIRRRPCKLQHAATLGVSIHREGKHPLAFYGTPAGLGNLQVLPARLNKYKAAV
ncbi:MAG: hypothetical protein KDE51_19140 [Anaerolineales bacterium]|nr:hypothetical protein [Anaerolineales bacterium]